MEKGKAEAFAALVLRKDGSGEPSARDEGRPGAGITANQTADIRPCRLGHRSRKVKGPANTQILSFAILVSTALSTSQVQAKDSRAQWTEIGTKYGGTMLKMVAVSTDTSLPPTSGNITAQQVTLRGVLTDYKEARARIQGTMLGFRGTVQLAIDGGTEVAVASGVGVVPAIVLRAAGQAATDAMFDGMQKNADIAVQNYLGSRKDQLLNIAGTSYEQLQALPPDQLKTKLEASTTIISDLDNLVPGDSNVKEMATQLVVDSIRNTQRATLDRLGTDETKITTVAGELTKFEKTTREALVAHNTAIGDLGSAVDNLSNSVAAVDDRLTHMEKDQGFVSDFVFNQMSPAAKSLALQNGFLADKFSCPGGGTSCDNAKLEEDLVKRFDAEAKVQSIVGNIVESASTINNVAAIANNIGLNDPVLNQAAGIASVAANAAASIATGNYLGAAVAISGMFAKKVDPDEVRFNAMMGYLKQEFQRINEKLDKILENQQKLMDAVVGLSNQLQSYYNALDERLVNIEFETKRISGLASSAAWKDWETCFTVYDYIKRNDDKFHVLGNGEFSSLSDMQTVLGAVGKDVLSQCLVTSLTRPASIAAANWFGNFLDADTAYQFTPPVLPAAEDATGKFYTKTDLKAFIDGIHGPAISLLEAMLVRRSVPPWRLFALLAEPNASASQIPDRLASPDVGVHPCGPDHALGDRLSRLLCDAPNGPDAGALLLLRKPMLVDGALDVASWIMVTARFADLQDPNNGNFWTANEVLDAARDHHLGSGGREIMSNLLMTMDAAIASYSMYYGDITAQSVLDALSAPKEADPAKERARATQYQYAVQLIQTNGYLSSNVAILLLRSRMNPASIQAYKTAVDYAVSNKADRFNLLSVLFGADLVFSVDDAKGNVMVKLADRNGTPINAQLPTPEFLLAGKLSYPPKMTELISMRQRIIERLLDYDFIAGRPPDEQAEVSTLVAHAGRVSFHK